jgi:DNA polymerase eta
MHLGAEGPSLPSFGSTDKPESFRRTSKMIIHFDMVFKLTQDAFYAQCEAKRLVTKGPLVVVQWSGILAVNYPARSFGITRSTSTKDALIACPDLVLAHVPTYLAGDMHPAHHLNPNQQTHKSSLDFYRQESCKIMDIIKKYSPKFEKASIDEAYLDVSDSVAPKVKSHNGVIDWTGTNIISVDDTSVSEQDFLSDLALCYAAQIAQNVRKDIFDSLGYTCSAGIAHNKTVAKLASARNKPNLQTVVPTRNIIAFMEPISLMKIGGLGGILGQEVVEKFGVTHAREIHSLDLPTLEAKLGESKALFVFNKARGICHANGYII